MTGKIIDKTTKEPVYNVQVFSSDQAGNITNPPVGTTSDFDGNYSIQPATTWLTFKHVGYQPVTVPRSFGSDTMDVQLDPGHELPEVEIIYDMRPWYIKYATTPVIATLLATALVATYFATKNQK